MGMILKKSFVDIQKWSPYQIFIDSLIQQINKKHPDFILNKEIDLNFLSQSQELKESYLNESSILTLSYLNYLNF